MTYEQITNDKDTPILVYYANGEKHFVMYMNTKKSDAKNGVKFIVVMALSALLYLIESVFIGIKGLKK